MNIDWDLFKPCKTNADENTSLLFAIVLRTYVLMYLVLSGTFEEITQPCSKMLLLWGKPKLSPKVA